MTEEEILQKIISVVSELYINPYGERGEIKPETCPPRDLIGFDSVNSFEASLVLSEAIGIELDAEFLVKKIRNKLPTIEIMASQIYEMQEKSLE